MENNIFIIAAIIACFFCIIKFLETKFIENEQKPLKFLIRDTFLVYFSAVLGEILFHHFISADHGKKQSTPIFTGSPDF